MPTPIEDQLTPQGGWQTLPRPRLELGDADTANAGQRLLLCLVKRIGKLDAANLWRLMMKNMRLMRGMLSFASKMMPFGELERRDTELCILRVGWNCRARYEWGQHVDIGMRAGLTAAEVARIPAGADAEGWTPRQAALLRACDELHQFRMVSDHTWQHLRAEFPDRMILEVLMLIGYYEGLAGVLNSTGLPLDEALEIRLANASIHGR